MYIDQTHVLSGAVPAECRVQALKTPNRHPSKYLLEREVLGATTSSSKAMNCLNMVPPAGFEPAHTV